MNSLLLQYALVSTIGRGSFGEVKLALNTKTFQVHALKLLPKSLKKRRAYGEDSPHIAEARVMSEINVMKKLSHPNIVRLIEVIGTSPNLLFMACLAFFGSTYASLSKITSSDTAIPSSKSQEGLIAARLPFGYFCLCDEVSVDAYA